MTGSPLLKAFMLLPLLLLGGWGGHFFLLKKLTPTIAQHPHPSPTSPKSAPYKTRSYELEMRFSQRPLKVTIESCDTEGNSLLLSEIEEPSPQQFLNPLSMRIKLPQDAPLWITCQWPRASEDFYAIDLTLQSLDIPTQEPLQKSFFTKESLLPITLESPF